MMRMWIALGPLMVCVRFVFVRLMVSMPILVVRGAPWGEGSLCEQHREGREQGSRLGSSLFHPAIVSTSTHFCQHFARTHDGLPRAPRRA